MASHDGHSAEWQKARVDVIVDVDASHTSKNDPQSEIGGTRSDHQDPLKTTDWPHVAQEAFEDYLSRCPGSKTEPGGSPTGQTNPGFSGDARYHPGTVITSSHRNPVSCKVPVIFSTS